MPFDFTNGVNQENLPCCGSDDCSDCFLMKGLGGAFIHAKGIGQAWVHTEDVLLDVDKDDKDNRSEKSRSNPLVIFGCCCCAFTHLTFGFGSNQCLRTTCAVLLPIWIILWLVAFFFDSLFFILALPFTIPAAVAAVWFFSICFAFERDDELEEGKWTPTHHCSCECLKDDEAPGLTICHKDCASLKPCFDKVTLISVWWPSQCWALFWRFTCGPRSNHSIRSVCAVLFLLWVVCLILILFVEISLEIFFVLLSILVFIPILPILIVVGCVVGCVGLALNIWCDDPE